jgi:2-O-(6-phospho-alpha-D-mannosyl)-D-glycerate hydrolase
MKSIQESIGKMSDFTEKLHGSVSGALEKVQSAPAPTPAVDPKPVQLPPPAPVPQSAGIQLPRGAPALDKVATEFHVMSDERRTELEKEYEAAMAAQTAQYKDYKIIIHVVSHTHWDREWYQSFEKYRKRFVWIVDDVLDRFEHEPTRFKHFHMDGQVIPFLDYLEIRPDRLPKLTELVTAGKLSIGPWYTAPDEFLASGEALMRNLLNGFRHGRRLGVRITKIGYMADTFGHVSQIPQLYRGFGIDNAVFARALPKPKAESYWASPDGSKVFVAYMAKWYCNGEGYPANSGGAFKFLSKEARSIGSVSTTKHRLLMDGCDHVAMNPHILGHIDMMNTPQHRKELGDALTVQSNLEHYVKMVQEASNRKSLKTYHGELRTDIAKLSHIYSNKITQKQDNWECQSLLEHYVEPIRAMGWAIGAVSHFDGDYQWYAWERILQNHAHDSAGGCSVSEVHRDVDYRNKICHEVARSLLDEALMSFSKKVSSGGGSSVLVFNTHNFPRHKEMVQVRMIGTGGKGFPLFEDVSTGETVLGAAVTSIGTTWDFMLPKVSFRAPFRAPISYYAFPASVPAFGYKVYRVKAWVADPDDGVRYGRGKTSGGTEENVMENDFVKVTINKNDGSFDMLDKRTSEIVCNHCNTFAVVRDSGDEYGFRGGGQPTSLSSVSFGGINRSPIGQVAKVNGQISMPSSGNMPVKVTYYLAAFSSRLEIRTSVDNHFANFRLQAIFPSLNQGKSIQVDSHFDTVSRSDQGGRQALAQQDFVQFTPTKSDGAGLNVANRGIPEYHVPGGSSFAITLLRATSKMGDWGKFPTAPSSNEPGHLSFEYAAMPYRKSGLTSGDAATTSAESVNSESSASVLSSMHQARAFNSPMATVQMLNYPGMTSSKTLFNLRHSLLFSLEHTKKGWTGQSDGGRGGTSWHNNGGGKLPNQMKVVDVQPAESLVLSAVKVTEQRDFFKPDGGTLLVRFYNQFKDSVAARIYSSLPVKEVYECNFLEERTHQLSWDASSHSVTMDVPGKKIINLEFVL